MNTVLNFEQGDSLLEQVGEPLLSDKVASFDADDSGYDEATGYALGRLKEELKVANSTVDFVILCYFLSTARSMQSLTVVRNMVWNLVSEFYSLTSPAKSDKSSEAKINRTAYNTLYAKVKRLSESCGATYYGQTFIYPALPVHECAVPFNGKIDWLEATARFAGMKATRKYIVDARIEAIDLAKERGETLPHYPK